MSQPLLDVLDAHVSGDRGVVEQECEAGRLEQENEAVGTGPEVRSIAESSSLSNFEFLKARSSREVQSRYMQAPGAAALQSRRQTVANHGLQKDSAHNRIPIPQTKSRDLFTKSRQTVGRQPVNQTNASVAKSIRSGKSKEEAAGSKSLSNSPVNDDKKPSGRFRSAPNSPTRSTAGHRDTTRVITADSKGGLSQNGGISNSKAGVDNTHLVVKPTRSSPTAIAQQKLNSPSRPPSPGDLSVVRNLETVVYSGRTTSADDNGNHGQSSNPLPTPRALLDQFAIQFSTPSRTEASSEYGRSQPPLHTKKAEDVIKAEWDAAIQVTHNRWLQFVYANGKAVAASMAKEDHAQKQLWGAMEATNALRQEVSEMEAKVMQMEMDQKARELLDRHERELQEWREVVGPHSAVLRESLQAVKATTLRLPVTGKIKVEPHLLREAIDSANQTLNEVGSSVEILQSTAELLSGELSQLSESAKDEMRVLLECGDQLVELSSAELYERSLQAHVVQIMQSQNRRSDSIGSEHVQTKS